MVGLGCNPGDRIGYCLYGAIAINTLTFFYFDQVCMITPVYKIFFN